MNKIKEKHVTHFAVTGSLKDALPICTNNYECAEKICIQVCQLLSSHRRSKYRYSTSVSS